MHTVSPPRCIKQKADQDSNKHCHSHRHFRFHSNPCVRAGTALEALLNSICFYIFFCFLFVTRRVRAHHPRPERACMHACMEAGQKSACTDQYVSSCATASAAVLRRSSNKTAATHNSCRPAQHIAQLLCAFFFFFFFFLPCPAHQHRPRSVRSHPCLSLRGGRVCLFSLVFDI